MQKISNFHELYDMAQSYRKGHWVFRGQSNIDYKVLPKIGRTGIESNNEQRILDFFKREGYVHENDMPENEWELLALAQHYGLPTRLLDWTENPLVAAYFACNENYDKDGAIYILKTDKIIRNIDESPFVIKNLSRYRPKHITRRITAQRGLFVIFPNPENELELSNKGIIKLHKLIIDKCFKEKLLWNLSRFGINRSSLFPDLDGLANHITWMFSNNDPSEEEYAK